MKREKIKTGSKLICIRISDALKPACRIGGIYTVNYQAGSDFKLAEPSWWSWEPKCFISFPDEIDRRKDT